MPMVLCERKRGANARLVTKAFAILKKIAERRNIQEKSAAPKIKHHKPPEEPGQAPLKRAVAIMVAI